MKKYLALLIILFACSVTAQAQRTAALGRVAATGEVYSSEAECTTSGPTFTPIGYGSNTVGGCVSGRTVSVITNLNSSGAGSYRNAIENASQNSLIRFQAGLHGYVTLTSEVELTTNNVTVDGGDAAVTIIGHATNFRASQVIVTNMAFRRGGVPDTPTEDDDDSVTILGFDSPTPIEHIYFRGVSATFGDDGNLDISNHVRNVTLENCLTSGSMGSGNNLIGPGGQSCDTDQPVTRITVCYSLYTQGSRNPEINSGVIAFINNVIYRNAGGNFLAFEVFAYSVAWQGEPSWDAINCAFIAGESENLDEPQNHRPMKLGENPACASNTNTMFHSGNIRMRWDGTELTTTNMVEVDSCCSIAGSRRADSIPNEMSAQDAIPFVLANAGRTIPYRDAIDTRIVNEVVTGTGSFMENDSEWNPPTNPPDWLATLPAPSAGAGRTAASSRSAASARIPVQ